MSSGNDPHANVEATLTFRPFPRAVSSEDDRAYVLVLHGNASTAIPLEGEGELIIGRAPECGISLPDASVSRRHAKLISRSGSLEVVDLGSHNGTRVNGEVIGGVRVLLSGDVIGIGELTLIVHRAARNTFRLLPPDVLRERIELEVLRARHQRREVSLLFFAVDRGADLPRLSLVLERAVSVLECAGTIDAGELIVVSPELEDPAARAERLLRAIAPVAPSARAGWASCPNDALDADALIGAARSAAQAAAPGASKAAIEAKKDLKIGEKTISIADPAMLRLYALIERLAPSNLPVLIWGETGTGKELASSALHYWSPRRDRALVTMNCAALPETLVESELFGYEKGAFSGAASAKEGLLERASAGTLFLDEIGELSLPVQAKLLRVLEAQKVTRLGGLEERSIDLRIVAATNRDLEAEVKAGRFREDLFFRLNAARIMLPPLRDRKRELPILARVLLGAARSELKKPPLSISPAAMQRLLAHRWPGNIRELRNVMAYVASTADGDVLEPWMLPEHLEGEASIADEAEDLPETETPAIFRRIEDELRDLERTRMIQALSAAGGVHKRAALMIGMPKRTFAAKFKLYNLAEVVASLKSKE